MRPKISYPAILVAAAVHWVLGAAWFTFFAKPWVAGLRLTDTQIKDIMAHPNPIQYVIAFIINLVIAFVLAWVILSTRRGLFAGLRTGLMLGVGVAALPIATELLFEYHSLPFIAIAAGYPLAGCILMGAILGAWPIKSGTDQSKAAAA